MGDTLPYYIITLLVSQLEIHQYRYLVLETKVLVNNTDIKQKTIKNDVSLDGVGLHTGTDVKLTFKPAPENFGFGFKRSDLEGEPVIKADVNFVTNTQRGTCLEKNGVTIQTCEHVLAALVGLDLDNVLIELNASEPPIMDGSSKFFIEAIE